MAKVIYYNNPLLSEYKESQTKAKTVLELLKELDLENSSNLGVRIDGKSYKNLDLFRDISSAEVIEVKHILNGSGGSAGRKNTLATIVTLAAVVAVSFINPAAAGAAFYKLGILVGASLISGALVRSGLSRAGDGNETENQVAAQAFSLTSAQNTARALQPMSVVMGSHRVAPDFGSRPYTFFSENPNSNTQNIWASTQYQYTGGFSESIPSGWLSNYVFNLFSFNGYDPVSHGFWDWPLKVMDNFDPSEFIATARLRESYPAQPSELRYRYDYLRFSSLDARSYSTTLGTLTGFGPTLILHDNPSDPVYQANGNQPFVSTLECLAWTYFSQFKFDKENPNAYIQTSDKPVFVDEAHGSSSVFDENGMIDLYLYLLGFNQGFSENPLTADSSVASGFKGFSNLYNKKDMNSENDYEFFSQIEEGSDIDISQPTSLSKDSLPLFGFDEINTFETKKQVIDNFFQGLQSENPLIFARFNTPYTIPDEPNLQEVRHIMHFGLGDIKISDKRIKNTQLESISGQQTLDVVKNRNFWSLDQSEYHSNVKIDEGAELLNNSQFLGPIGNASLDPNVLINWVTRQTPDNCEKIQINIEGNSFLSEDDGSFSFLPATFEIQIKKTSDPVFSVYDGALVLGSNKPEAIRKTIDIDLSSDPDSYIVRIRKKNKDPENSREVQDFKVNNFNFFVVDNLPYIAENRQGLRLRATGSFNGTTQSYNTLVEAKCWVKKGGQWYWEHTRNPAWWFLYFARGGFLNNFQDGSQSYPRSPTVGWLNLAGDTQNTERLFGAGLKDENIDIEKIEEWSDFCLDNDLYFDAVLQDTSNTIEVLEFIANVGRASTSVYRGKLTVCIEDPEEPVVGMYGMGNIIKDSFTVTYTTDDLPDRIIGTYTDRNDEWKTKTVEAIVPNAVDELKRVEISLGGVTERDQAQRAVNLLAARQLYQRRSYTWKTDEQGLIARRGQLVYLSHDVTQYDQSGRAFSFNVVDGQVTGIDTNIELKETTQVMVREPSGAIKSYEATSENEKIVFSESYDLENAPMYPFGDNSFINKESKWKNSMPEDFLFFSGPRETLGKVVRISDIKADSDLNFTIDAVEEEAAMYAYEYDQTLVETEISNRIVAKVFNVSYKNLGSGVVELNWELDGAIGAEIYNTDSPSFPIQSGSASTIYGQKARIELNEGETYTLSIKPVVVGSPYEKENALIEVKT